VARLDGPGEAAAEASALTQKCSRAGFTLVAGRNAATGRHGGARRAEGTGGAAPYSNIRVPPTGQLSTRIGADFPGVERKGGARPGHGPGAEVDKAGDPCSSVARGGLAPARAGLRYWWPTDNAKNPEQLRFDEPLRTQFSLQRGPSSNISTASGRCSRPATSVRCRVTGRNYPARIAGYWKRRILQEGLT